MKRWAPPKFEPPGRPADEAVFDRARRIQLERVGKVPKGMKRIWLAPGAGRDPGMRAEAREAYLRRINASPSLIQHERTKRHKQEHRMEKAKKPRWHRVPTNLLKDVKTPVDHCPFCGLLAENTAQTHREAAADHERRSINMSQQGWPMDRHEAGAAWHAKHARRLSGTTRKSERTEKQEARAQAIRAMLKQRGRTRPVRGYRQRSQVDVSTAASQGQTEKEAKVEKARGRDSGGSYETGTYVHCRTCGGTAPLGRFVEREGVPANMRAHAFMMGHRHANPGHKVEITMSPGGRKMKKSGIDPALTAAMRDVELVKGTQERKQLQSGLKRRRERHGGDRALASVYPGRRNKLAGEYRMARREWLQGGKTLRGYLKKQGGETIKSLAIDPALTASLNEQALIKARSGNRRQRGLARHKLWGWAGGKPKTLGEARKKLETGFAQLQSKQIVAKGRPFPKDTAIHYRAERHPEGSMEYRTHLGVAYNSLKAMRAAHPAATFKRIKASRKTKL
jgi:hypothetical protein